MIASIMFVMQIHHGSNEGGHCKHILIIHSLQIIVIIILDNAIIFNNYGWTMYDDHLVTEKEDMGWQTSSTIAVSIVLL